MKAWFVTYESVYHSEYIVFAETRSKAKYVIYKEIKKSPERHVEFWDLTSCRDKRYDNKKPLWLDRDPQNGDHFQQDDFGCVI